MASKRTALMFLSHVRRSRHQARPRSPGIFIRLVGLPIWGRLVRMLLTRMTVIDVLRNAVNGLEVDVSERDVALGLLKSGMTIAAVGLREKGWIHSDSSRSWFQWCCP